MSKRHTNKGRLVSEKLGYESAEPPQEDTATDSFKVRIIQPESDELSQQASCGFRLLAMIIAKQIRQGEVDERRSIFSELGFASSLGESYNGFDIT